MKVSFRQSGGYAGLIRGAELDTDVLPDKEARELRRLVRESALSRLRREAPPNARDVTTYEIMVESEDGYQRVTLDDASVDPAMEPLLEYLQERAGPRTPG